MLPTASSPAASSPTISSSITSPSTGKTPTSFVGK